MLAILVDYLENFWQLLSAIAPYILVGIFLAGAMKLWIRDAWIQKELGRRSLWSSVKAILLGIPLPLCSCSVIPFATALRQSGASKPSTLSFLIATPITGVDSIAATYGVLGWFFTLYRIVSSIVIALLAAVLSLLFDREDQPRAYDAGRSVSFSVATTSRTPVGLGAFSPLAISVVESFSGGCASGSCCGGDAAAEREAPWPFRLWSAAVESIFADFAKALLVGIALGALLVTFLPPEIGAYLGENLWLNYLLVIAVAAPLYICATSSIPLGVALLTAGVSPGAVFVFLTAGPASSTVTMSVIRKVLGTRSLILYLIAVFSGTLLFGALFDTFFARQAAAVKAMVHDSGAPGLFAQFGAVVLLILSWHVLRPRRSGCCDG